MKVVPTAEPFKIMSELREKDLAEFKPLRDESDGEVRHYIYRNPKGDVIDFRRYTDCSDYWTGITVTASNGELIWNFVGSLAELSEHPLSKCLMAMMMKHFADVLPRDDADIKREVAEKKAKEDETIASATALLDKLKISFENNTVVKNVDVERECTTYTADGYVLEVYYGAVYIFGDGKKERVEKKSFISTNAKFWTELIRR